MPETFLLTHEYFESLVEKSFTVGEGQQAVSLRVTAVRMLPAPKRQTPTGRIVDVPGTRLPFSVYFRSEGQIGLRQGTYSMTPPDAAVPLSIFVVPLGIEHGGVIYEAIFN